MNQCISAGASLSGREHELEVQAGDRHPLPGLGHVVGRRDQADRARRGASRRARRRPGPWGRRAAGCRTCSSTRRLITLPGQHVLGHRGLEEADRRDDLDLAGAHVGLVDDPARAAVVVDVAVGVARARRPACAAGARSRARAPRAPSRSRSAGRRRRCPSSPSTIVMFDRSSVADLVEPRHDLVEAALDDQLHLPPQARVDRLRRLGVRRDERRSATGPRPGRRRRRAPCRRRAAARSARARPPRSPGDRRSRAPPAIAAFAALRRLARVAAAIRCVTHRPVSLVVSPPLRRRGGATVSHGVCCARERAVERRDP